jgi:hypothetical protein
MSDVLTPNLRTYPIRENSLGCIAEFPPGQSEYLKVERFTDSIGINWTTDLSPEAVPKAIASVLPGNAVVEVWHSNRIDELTSPYLEDIQQAIRSEKTTRITYEIEPGRVSRGGLIFAWRIRNNAAEKPHQLGVRVAEEELTIPIGLLAVTATPRVRNSPDLLIKVLQNFNKSSRAGT